MTITGKILEIIDNRTVATNVGSSKGVEVGMIFQIIAKDGKEIIDPDTEEVLGTLKLPKSKVKVTYVEEKYSLAETFEYERINVGGINTLQGFSNVFSAPKYIKKYKTFEIPDDQKRSIEEEKSNVKVGDIITLAQDSGETTAI
jgi:hypothetical protein